MRAEDPADGAGPFLIAAPRHFASVCCGSVGAASRSPHAARLLLLGESQPDAAVQTHPLAVGGELEERAADSAPGLEPALGLAAQLGQVLLEIARLEVVDLLLHQHLEGIALVG